MCSVGFQTQLTDFENAAYTVFVVLLTRVILSYKLNFIIPISKVQYLHWWNSRGLTQVELKGTSTGGIKGDKHRWN